MEQQVTAVVGTAARDVDQSVGSRISWGAVMGGAAVALGIYYLLGILTTAVGLSVYDGVTARDLTAGTVVWLIIVTCIAMFCGAFVTNLFTVGEDSEEAVLLGLITWATVTTILVLFGAMGLKSGLNAVVGVVDVANRSAPNWEQAARENGISQDRINAWKAEANAKVDDPEARREARAAARRLAWITFAGVWLSMFAAAGGAHAGKGPAFRFVPIVVSRRTVLTT
ncbi:hypothetical protein [Zavarzinella formosa]|uniref:hypothetical protein n=1 Tax=Zavarzinella formosa TaxID=360055 RepID=UPI000303F61E|nr:hypothetical protein [Zavarzinella formosa]